MPDLVVTQVRSSIGAKPKHRGTLRALGLGRIGKSNTLPDRPEIRGMIAKVPHMITVDEAESAGEEKAPAKTTAKKVAAKKAPAEKAPAKTTTKKATAKKAPAKKAPAKKAPAKKAAAAASKSRETRES
jgi:large subunit ribosomal protein L30